MFLKMEEPQHGMTLEQAFDRARNTVNTLCEQIMQKKQQEAYTAKVEELKKKYME